MLSLCRASDQPLTQTLILIGHLEERQLAYTAHLGQKHQTPAVCALNLFSSPWILGPEQLLSSVSPLPRASPKASFRPRVLKRPQPRQQKVVFQVYQS